ncbi:MAG: tRNA (adenosine(37)-N6)-dimethylallyltransferase MiaA, partial [Alphaproteobacteria bacterium]|nr:tRNA (adenosine(37)-N6)-dimethylallyltransferase MiaA [Alphaproteobacteria bacterium]
LHAAIERRFEAMLAAGALDEVAALAARGLDPSLPVMRAHGVPELMAHLAGTMSLEAAAAAAILNTRHYVKRQLTWARRRMADWVWLGKGEAAREGATLSARRDRV